MICLMTRDIVDAVGEAAMFLDGSHFFARTGPASASRRPPL